MRGFCTADVSNATQRLYSAGPQLRPRSANRRLCGYAFTVKVPPGDNLFVLAALELAQPGEVLVIDSGGDDSCAMIGELLTEHSLRRGLAGFAIDGAIRDAEHLSKSAMPIFSRAVTNRGAAKAGPGEINVPVVCGRMAVSPGDIVLGDEDGLVFLPNRFADEVKAYVHQRESKEQAFRARIAAGEFGARIEELMSQAGYTLTKSS